MKMIDFLLLICGIITFIAGFVYGFDREMARRSYEYFSSNQQEQIVGCIYESNCKYYNDLLEKQYD